jgi:hypothetical protein
MVILLIVTEPIQGLAIEPTLRKVFEPLKIV